MKRLKRLLAAVLALSFLFCLPVSADVQKDEPKVATEYYSEDMFEDFEEEAVPTIAAPSADAISLTCKSAVLMEVSTGTVLYENKADEKMPPASITKIMTLLLVMEAIEAGKFTLESEVTCSEHAASMGGSQIWLETGETMTVNDLLKATCVASANDAAVALGEFVAGSEEAFVGLMNERAAELGMTNTHFVNACGLDADGHLSTARDVAIMSRALVRHDLIK